MPSASAARNSATRYSRRAARASSVSGRASASSARGRVPMPVHPQDTESAATTVPHVLPKRVVTLAARMAAGRMTGAAAARRAVVAATTAMIAAIAATAPLRVPEPPVAAEMIAPATTGLAMTGLAATVALRAPVRPTRDRTVGRPGIAPPTRTARPAGVRPSTRARAMRTCQRACRIARPARGTNVRDVVVPEAGRAATTVDRVEQAVAADPAAIVDPRLIVVLATTVQPVPIVALATTAQPVPIVARGVLEPRRAPIGISAEAEDAAPAAAHRSAVIAPSLPGRRVGAKRRIVQPGRPQSPRQIFTRRMFATCSRKSSTAGVCAST